MPRWRAQARVRRHRGAVDVAKRKSQILQLKGRATEKNARKGQNPNNFRRTDPVFI